MAAAVASYSHDHFHRLPDLTSARDKFLKSNGPILIKDVLEKFFIANGMDRTFGLAMPHRHFDINPGEVLVTYNGTSTAWNVTPGEGMDEPQPAIWSFSSSGELVPHEFRYSKGHRFEMGEKEHAFVADFKCLLDKMNVAGVFGLCEYPGDDFEGTCEISTPSANINLTLKDVRQSSIELEPTTNLSPTQYPEGLTGIDTAWFFSPPLMKRGCRCTCDNRSKPHGHGSHIITQSG
jgi:hypothetical protein